MGSEIVWDDTPIPPFLPASGSVLLPNDDILRRDKYEKQVKLYWVELKIGGRKLMLDMFKAALKFHIASQGNFKLDKKQLRMTSVSFGVHSYGNWSSILGSESGKCWKKMRICLRMK